MGGENVEGIYFVAYYADDIQLPRFQSFKRRYMERFGRTANFASAFSYEAVQVITTAIEANGGRTEGFERRLPGLEIDGLMGQFTIDEYGDVHRAHYIVTISEGRFVTLKTIQ
jgi:branched-chain amino acid transport system substrate-binding protein